jgi:hypothetical protein
MRHCVGAAPLPTADAVAENAEDAETSRKSTGKKRAGIHGSNMSHFFG